MEGTHQADMQIRLRKGQTPLINPIHPSIYQTVKFKGYLSSPQREFRSQRFSQRPIRSWSSQEIISENKLLWWCQNKTIWLTNKVRYFSDVSQGFRWPGWHFISCLNGFSCQICKKKKNHSVGSQSSFTNQVRLVCAHYKVIHILIPQEKNLFILWCFCCSHPKNQFILAQQLQRSSEQDVGDLFGSINKGILLLHCNSHEGIWDKF